MKCSILTSILLVFTSLAKAEEGKPQVSLGAFVDTYYAYDPNNPSTIDRPYTTVPARNNEFNVNLAFIEAKLADEDLRGRFALQAGTSVQANYSSEPKVGQVSGPSLDQHVQEATIGYKLSDKLWIDAGIYFSHIGFESFITRDNWTYTKSLLADYSPYYQAGVRLSYEFSPKLTCQFHVINGWQNISENNGNKAIGTQLVFSPSDSLSFTDNTYLGQEGSSYLTRFLNDFFVTYNLTPTFQLAYVIDLGSQANPNGSNNSTWYGSALFSRVKITERDSITIRGERFVDRDQVVANVVAGADSSNGFSAWGSSIDYDRALRKYLLWRTEAKHLWADDAIFPKGAGYSSQDWVFVSSLALTL